MGNDMGWEESKKSVVLQTKLTVVPFPPFPSSIRPPSQAMLAQAISTRSICSVFPLCVGFLSFVVRGSLRVCCLPVQCGNRIDSGLLRPVLGERSRFWTFRCVEIHFAIQWRWFLSGGSGVFQTGRRRAIRCGTGRLHCQTSRLPRNTEGI